MDRDHLLFRAGQASMKRSWVWPFAAVVMSISTACLAMILVLRSTPEPIIQIVQVPVQRPQPEKQEPALHRFPPPELIPGLSTAPLSYWNLQQQALRFGVESLPSLSVETDDESARPIEKHETLSAGSVPRFGDEFTGFIPGVP